MISKRIRGKENENDGRLEKSMVELVKKDQEDF